MKSNSNSRWLCSFAVGVVSLTAALLGTGCGTDRLPNYAPTAPGAAVTPRAASTNPNGIAGARWVLGSTSGTQLVIARVVGNGAPDGIEATFEASVRSADAR